MENRNYKTGSFQKEVKIYNVKELSSKKYNFFLKYEDFKYTF